jgi:transposase
MQLEVKTILNLVQHYPGFVYRDVRLVRGLRAPVIEVRCEPHRSVPPCCSVCGEPCPGYDHLPERSWQFIPLWGFFVSFFYVPRRVACPQDGVVVEAIPWSEGKRPVTKAMMAFLARWARHLSWSQTARMFRTSWRTVYHSVEWFVEWGLAHRTLEGVQAIGVDEIHWRKGQKSENYLTVIYQIDAHCRRLLWVGSRRTEKTLRRGLAELGPALVAGLRFVCSDLWRPYLNVIAAEAGQALHVLDRFHIVMHLNEAVDQTRRAESGRLRQSGSALAGRLKQMRWTLQRRGSRVRGRARRKLHALVASKLATARAWNLKESFDHFWSYRSVIWAGAFLDCWCGRALRSRIEPMKRVARMLRRHEELLLNWFRAKGELSSGAVEGQNNKIRVVTRRSYGFRTYKVIEIALYHTLGKLPEPDEFTHTF